MGMFVEAFNNSFEKKSDEILEAAAMKANGERENSPSIRDCEIGCFDDTKVRNVKDTSNENPFVGTISIKSDPSNHYSSGEAGNDSGAKGLCVKKEGKGHEDEKYIG